MKKRRQQSGFTLIELAVVLGVSVMIASALVGMFNAHLQMMNQAAQYRFLAKDAPFIGLLLTRTIGNAEDYRIGGHLGIYFFLADDVTGTFPTAPSWELAGGQLTNTDANPIFDASKGILLATLKGSYNDEYTFAAEKK